ncbi:MAG: BatA and WFA domain-containing protein, partial [Rhodothermales bacterium]
MEFLNPLALVALAAAAIPLLIHLFNFRKPRRVDFSSLQFVRELQKTTMQRVRIKQWLLLLLRMLAIAFLVLAFARPTLTGDMATTVGGRAATSVAVVLDNSLSMTLRDAEGEYLRQAKDIAAGIAGEMQSGDELFLVASGEEGRPARYSATGPALEAIEGMESSPGAEKLPQSIRRAGDALASAANLNKEIYVLTDLQETSLSDTLRPALVEDIHVYLLPVGDRRHRNVAVTDVVVESRIIEVGQPVRISATLMNHGDEPLEGYVASVY